MTSKAKKAKPREPRKPTRGSAFVLQARGDDFFIDIRLDDQAAVTKAAWSCLMRFVGEFGDDDLSRLVAICVHEQSRRTGTYS